MATDAGLYQILEIPEPKDRAKHLLGSVIPSNFYTAPLTKYAPYFESPRWETSEEGKREKEELDKHLASFWKTQSESVPLSKLLSSQGTSRSDRTIVGLTEALKARFNKSAEKNFKIEDGETLQYNMDNAGRALEERLWKCKPWKDEVQTLYENDKREGKDLIFLIVTGIWLCRNTRISWDDQTTSEQELGLRIPFKDAASATANSLAIPITPESLRALDLELNKDRSREQQARASVTLPEPTIFAVRYHKLEIIPESVGTKPTDNKSAENKSAESNKGQTSFVGSFLSKLKPKRRNTGPTELPRPAIKSLSLGEPLRGGSKAIGSYGAGVDGSSPNGLLYLVEPDYVSPDDIGAEQTATEAGGEANGVAH